MIKYDLKIYQSGECTKKTQCWADTAQSAKNYATRWAMRTIRLPLNKRYRWSPLYNETRGIVGFVRDFVNCSVLIKTNQNITV